MSCSYWDSDALLSADFVVVGAGLIGLQTALELRALRPRDRIIVLERGVVPSGASSRNAGFACFGSLTEILADLDLIGEDRVLETIERRWSGLQRLRRRVPDAAMRYEPAGGNELFSQSDLPAIERLDEVNRLLKPLFGRAVFSRDDDAIGRAGFGRTFALLRNPLEGQLHSGMLMGELARLARLENIEIRTGATVLAIHEEGKKVDLRIAVSEQNQISMSAGRVVVCTNGFTANLFPEAGIVPARGQILVTAPVPDLRWRGTYHMEQGFYYFRNLGNRILLGGGRHLAMQEEATDEMVVTPDIQDALVRLLRQVVLPDHEVAIDYRWAGIMGFSADRMPQVRMLSPRVALGFGCNGMGVALGAQVAAELAALISSGP
ncbi:MAG: FAD-dependent oxidoreductase [Herminiimonas sp.]|nr:FAD-dependent oxidoreductase [Herminiimonas sp.]